ncbi:TetR/AcrR family transcriptional regulator [Rhodopirellula sp. MGV]|uniref:TetR/AcrR family transcriptional regulator n=1 Tax=Rhodopirellula sp. MGV TaxID=2023130 RepID=UPI0013040931|nr:TetR/AcrR family transcriptional regulator [Rhodopirellula sp. MGV]
MRIARPRLARGGLAALSMEAIAREMSYAKGTIYNHFSCKEEILLALAIGANNKRRELFLTAVESMSTSRDKIAAIGVACQDFRVRFADLFQIDVLVRHSTVWEKVSEQRREAMALCEQRCMGVVVNVGMEAVRRGDLTLPDSLCIEDVMFGLWSLTYGGMLIEGSSPGLDRLGIHDGFSAIRRNCHALMDGYQWKPLYDAEHDEILIQKVRSLLHREVGQELKIESESAVADGPSSRGTVVTVDPPDAMASQSLQGAKQ